MFYLRLVKGIMEVRPSLLAGSKLRTRRERIEELHSFGFQATSIIEAFKSKIEKEQKVADEVIRKGLFT